MPCSGIAPSAQLLRDVATASQDRAAIWQGRRKRNPDRVALRVALRPFAAKLQYPELQLASPLCSALDFDLELQRNLTDLETQLFLGCCQDGFAEFLA